MGHEVSDYKAHSLHTSQVVVFHNCDHHTPSTDLILLVLHLPFTPQGKPAGTRKDRRIYSLSPKNKGYILSPFKASQALLPFYPPHPSGSKQLSSVVTLVNIPFSFTCTSTSTHRYRIGCFPRKIHLRSLDLSS